MIKLSSGFGCRVEVNLLYFVLNLLYLFLLIAITDVGADVGSKRLSSTQFILEGSNGRLDGRSTVVCNRDLALDVVDLDLILRDLSFVALGTISELSTLYPELPLTVGMLNVCLRVHSNLIDTDQPEVMRRSLRLDVPFAGD